MKKNMFILLFTRLVIFHQGSCHKSQDSYSTHLALTSYIPIYIGHALKEVLVLLTPREPFSQVHIPAMQDPSVVSNTSTIFVPNEYKLK
jgi:hypothetical protein